MMRAKASLAFTGSVFAYVLSSMNHFWHRRVIHRAAVALLCEDCRQVSNSLRSAGKRGKYLNQRKHTSELNSR